MKKVSVIIPTFNSEKTVLNCLKSVKKQSFPNIEIIVVDNNSRDKTKEIAKKFTKNIFNKGPERSSQRNYGAKKSSGDYLLFIDSDMILSKNVVTDCVDKVDKTNIKSIIIHEKSFGTSFWAKCKSLERSFYTNVVWMEAARFFLRDTFNEFNGYDENNTGTEDYDLPQRIIAAYGDKVQSSVNSLIFHNEGNLSLISTLKKKFYYAKNLATYYNKNENKKNFLLQSSILNRYALFFSNPQLLFKNPLVGAGMLFMKTMEFFFGALGLLLK